MKTTYAFAIDKICQIDYGPTKSQEVKVLTPAPTCLSFDVISSSNVFLHTKNEANSAAISRHFRMDQNYTNFGSDKNTPIN